MLICFQDCWPSLKAALICASWEGIFQPIPIYFSIKGHSFILMSSAGQKSIDIFYDFFAPVCCSCPFFILVKKKFFHYDRNQWKIVAPLTLKAIIKSLEVDQGFLWYHTPYYSKSKDLQCSWTFDLKEYLLDWTGLSNLHSNVCSIFGGFTICITTALTLISQFRRIVMDILM